MDIESTVDGIAFIILLSALGIYLIDLFSRFVLKINKRQSLLFYSAILFEGSMLFIFLALKYLSSFYLFLRFEDLFMAILLFFVSFLSTKLGISYYNESRNEYMRDNTK